jgi:glycerol-3-phosphate acyltransferase PlsY
VRDVILLLLAYGLGSLPWSLWTGNLRGVDLRRHGSGNLGATNVYRVLGWKLGLAVLLLDVAKGTAAVVLARNLGSGGAVAVLAGLAAVAGHMWTPFAGFRGGKGVATSLGVFLGLAPAAAGGAFLVWAACLALGGWVSVASGIAALLLPILVFLSRPDLGDRYAWVLGFSILLAILVLYRHRANWFRLAEGKEQRIWERRRETPEGGAEMPAAGEPGR